MRLGLTVCWPPPAEKTALVKVISFEKLHVATRSAHAGDALTSSTARVATVARFLMTLILASWFWGLCPFLGDVGCRGRANHVEPGASSMMRVISYSSATV